MNKRREQEIVDALLQFEKQRANEPGQIILDPDNEQHKLVFDLKKTPHAFVVGCVLDRNIPAEKAWAAPYKLKQRIGNFSFSTLRQLKRRGWKKYLGPQKGDPEKLHRFWNTVMPDCLHSAVQVIDKYSNNCGKAQRLWSGNKLSGKEVVDRFKEIKGVGDKIANMAVRILVTRFGQQIETASIDVSVDVHVAKVFPRLGLVHVDKGATKSSVKKLIVEKARKLHSEFPAEIDPPLFIIGKNYCHKTNPNCVDCPMVELCEYAATHKRKPRRMKNQIPAAAIETAAHQIMHNAAIDIPADYRGAVASMAAREEGLSCFVLQTMLDNYDAASADRRPMCADTGLPRYYVKVGNEARIEGGMVALERALRSATARATRDIPLRPNRVHPLWRTDPNNNVGMFAPEIDWSFEPRADWLELTTVHKGGLFGTDYRMLFPGDGVDGIKRFLLDTLIAFGKRGLACQPAIVGIGLGGAKDACMTLGKQAACLRIVGDRHPDPKIAALELELMELGNSIGMGPMGFTGRAMVADLHIEVGHTHTGGMPMSVHTFCLSSRRATVRIRPGDEPQYRSDPRWFSDYTRREGIE